MSGSNKGSFEPCFLPLGVEQVDAPRGLARLVASQEAHASDLERLGLGIEDEHEEAVIASTRKTFIADVKRFVIACARLSAPWDEVEQQIDAGCRRARVALTLDEKLELYEAFDAEYPWESKAA